jgi:hypothetical protein
LRKEEPVALVKIFCFCWVGDNPSTREAEAGRYVLEGRPGLHTETLPQKKNNFVVAYSFLGHNLILATSKNHTKEESEVDA